MLRVHTGNASSIPMRRETWGAGGAQNLNFAMVFFQKNPPRNRELWSAAACAYHFLRFKYFEWIKSTEKVPLTRCWIQYISDWTGEPILECSSTILIQNKLYCTSYIVKTLKEKCNRNRSKKTKTKTFLFQWRIFIFGLWLDLPLFETRLISLFWKSLHVV